MGSVLGEMGTDTVLAGPESWGGMGDYVVSSYKQGWGQPEPKVFPQSSLSPNPEAPAWLLEDFAVGTSGEQLAGQGQSRSRGHRTGPPWSLQSQDYGKGQLRNKLEVHMSTETHGSGDFHAKSPHTPTRPH